MGGHCVSDDPKPHWEVVDDVQIANGQYEIVSAFDRLPIIARHIDPLGELGQALGPGRIAASDQQRTGEPTPHKREAIEAVLERALVEEQLEPDAGGAPAAQRARLHVEQLGGLAYGH